MLGGAELVGEVHRVVVEQTFPAGEYGVPIDDASDAEPFEVGEVFDRFERTESVACGTAMAWAMGCSVFSEVSGALRQRPGLLLASAALAVVDAAAPTFTVATAGHPPPVPRLPDGEDTANAPIMRIPWTRSIADTLPFPLGAQLVMCTGGLVDRRDRRFDIAVERVANYLAGLADRRGTDELLEGLLGALIGDDDPEDDIAILVIKHVV